MKRLLVRLLFLAVAAMQFSGCVIEPWGHDRGRHEGEYRHSHHGEKQEGHGGDGEHR